MEPKYYFDKCVKCGMNIYTSGNQTLCGSCRLKEYNYGDAMRYMFMSSASSGKTAALHGSWDIETNGVNQMENNKFPKTVTVKNFDGFYPQFGTSALSGIQMVQNLEKTAEQNPDFEPVGVYALIKVVERKKDITDFKNGTYYWTDKDGNRNRIQDLSTEHLRQILTMPDFKNSRLTPRMKKAITSELRRRDYTTKF